MKIGQIKNAVASIQQFELFLLIPESTIADHVQLTVGGTAQPTLSLVHQRWPNGSVRSVSVFSNLPVTTNFQDVAIFNQAAGTPSFLTQAQIATAVAGTSIATTGPSATRSMVTDVNAGKWQIRPMQSVGGTAVVTPVIVRNFDAGAEITHLGAKMRPLYEAVIWSPTLAHVSVTLDQADSEALPLIKRDYANITINIGSTVALNQSNVILGTGTINTIQKWIGTPNDSHEFLFDRIFLNTSGMYLNAPAGPFDVTSWYNPAVATMNSANPNAQGFSGDGILGASVVADSMSAGGAGGRSDLGWRSAQQIYAYLLGTKDSRKLAITLARQYTAFPLFLRERNASKVIDSSATSGLNLPLSSYDRPSLGVAGRTLAGASFTTVNSDVQFYSSAGVALAKGPSGSSPTSWIGIYQDWNTEGAKFDDIGHFSPYWFSANVFQPRHLWCEANYFAANFAYHVWPEQYSNDPDNRSSVNTIDYAANRSPGMAKIGNGEGQREMFRNFAVLADAVAMLPNATNTGFNALQTTLNEVIEAINGYFKIQNVSVIENWWYTVRNATSLSAADKQLGYLNHEGPYTNVGELYPASAIDTSTANQRKAQNGYAQWMDMEGLYAFKSFVRRGYASGQGILDYIAFGARNRAGSSAPSVFGQYTEPKVDWTTGLSYSSAAAVIADADVTECNKNWPGGANFPASPSIAANLESGYAVVRQAIAKLLLDMGAANNSAATNSLLAGPANSYFSIYPKFHFEQVICTPPTITTAGTTVFSGVESTPNTFGAQALPVVSPSNVTTLFSLISAPTWASINALTGAVSIAAGSAVGNFNSVRRIGNGCLPNADQNISFVISAATGVAPAFTSPNTSSGASGSQPSYTATATGTTPIAFSIAPAVAGWSINASTGVVTGPALTTSQSITIVASNGVSPNASQVVTFNVAAQPQLVIFGLPSTVVAGQSYSITVSSGGSPVVGASVSINGVPVGTTNASGVLNAVMPAAANNVPVVASASGYTSATQTITITAATVAPVFTSGNTADAQGNYTATASGSPAPTFSINPPVVGWSVNSATGVVTHPLLTANITVQIQAINSAGTATQSVSFLAQTVAPVFTSGSTSNSASQYTATATGTAPIVFSIAPAVAGWSIDPSTGVVTHPVISTNQTIIIVASNGTAPNASLAVSFVRNAPFQLVLTGLPPTTILGQSYFVSVTSEGSPISGADVSIGGVSFGVTDAFGYLTVVMPAQANNVLVVASRSGYVSASQVINIMAPTVAPTITSPLAALPVVSGSVPVYTATATGTLPIVWSLIGAPVGWSINSSTGVITAPAITATQGIIVQASNGTSPNAMQAVVFAVTTVIPPKVCINDPDNGIASAKTGKICLVYWPFRFPKRDK